MAGGDDYFDMEGNFEDAGNTGVESNPDDFYDNSYFQPEEINHPLYLNGKPVNEKKDRSRRKKDNSDKSKADLSNAEKGASGKPNINGKGGDKNASLGEKERNVDSENQGAANTIKNSVKGVKDIKSGHVLRGLKGIKKGGPLGVIIAILLISVTSSFLGQSALPFSLVSQFRESFDSISVSQNTRSRAFLRWQTAIDSDKMPSCIKAHYFKADEFKPSKRMTNKLAKQNITFEEDADGITVMKFKKEGQATRTIVADKKQAGNGRVYFQDAIDNDPDFATAYKDGSKVWRGPIGAWFDSSMKGLLNKLGVERGVWRKFKNRNKQDQDIEGMRDTIGGNADSDSINAKGQSSTAETTNEQGNVDKNGNAIADTDGDNRAAQSLSTSGDQDDLSLSRGDVKIDSDGNVDTSGLKSKLTGVADSVGKISGIAEAATSVYCGVADVVTAISGIVAAYQTAQIIQVAANIFEGIQKAQIGDGESSPINAIGQSLTQKTGSTYSEVRGVKKDSSGNYTEDESKTLTINRERSAMEAESVKAIYGRTAVNSNDPGVKSFNVNSYTKNLYSGLSSIFNYVNVSAASWRSCTYAKLTAATVSAATDVIEIGICAFTFGVGCVVDFLLDQGSQAVFSAAFSMAVSVVVSFAVPHVAKVLTRKFATEILGEDLGNALVSGANMYMGKNHQYSGGAVANKDSLVAYLQEKDRIIAEEASYERETRSPFDITSKYTFFGSLANQLIPFASSMTSLTSSINGAGTVIANAISAFTPNSSAVSAAIEAQVEADNTAENCADLADIGGVGDAFCNPYVITDLRTIEDEPAAVVNSISDSDLTSDSNGNPVVVDDSWLAKYIVYCGQRSSPWGQADQNIAGEVDKAGSVGGTYGSAIIGAIPVVGDAFDIISDEQKLANYGWISGESCVIDNKTSGADSAKWSDAKKYQRFIEDQRLAEAEGIIEESAVTKYLASYYEKHPLDNSFEGILARYSGFTKEKVSDTLALMELSEWVADYEPADLAPYAKKESKEEELKLEDKNIINTFEYIAINTAAIINGRSEYNYSA